MEISDLSILDGWWPEAYDGGNGWAIGDTNDWSDLDAQDSFDVESLYSLLETEIVPAFKKPKNGQRRWPTRSKPALRFTTRIAW